MIKLKRGPLIVRYAEIYGCNVDDVVEWMNDYINHPEKYTQAEDTEKERVESIKGYVSAMIRCSTYGRIKEALEAVKKVEP